MGCQDTEGRDMVPQIFVRSQQVDGIGIEYHRFADRLQQTFQGGSGIQVRAQTGANTNGRIDTGLRNGREMILMGVEAQHGLRYGCLKDHLGTGRHIGRQQADTTSQTGFGGQQGCPQLAFATGHQ